MSNKKTEREAVKVAIRCRPLSTMEREHNYDNIINIDQSNSAVHIRNQQSQNITFTYDYSFPETCTQEEIYELTSSPIVSAVLEGMNGTIFAYGQTGTGKTYTMDGKSTGEHKGIVPRALEHIFDYIRANSESHQFLVTVVYVEIYNDEIRDLLAEKNDQPLKIREDPNSGVTIKGVAVHKVKEIEDLWKLLSYGKKNRKVRKTNMNDESSRSHSILTLGIETLTQIDGQDHVRSAKLNLVDLAGSERVAKTGVEGIGFLEGVNINYELMILGNCISALTTRGNTHIPYRDSKLTMLLKDSLGGNAKTLMIAAIGPADYNFPETMSTLRYAERAKKIENKPTVNMDPKDALLLKLKGELEELQSKLTQKGNMGQQLGASEDVIRVMEEKLEIQRKELAQTSNMIASERANLQMKLEKRMQKIQNEKQRQNEYMMRLNELNSYLVNGEQDLKLKTVKNEAQITNIRRKLKEREERTQKIQKEIEERKKKEFMMNKECTTIQAQVKQVSEEFEEAASSYKNLKILYPEIQNTIQSDREALTNDIVRLSSQIELYQQIIDNFIPQADVERVKSMGVFDENTHVWKMVDEDKKKLVQKVVSFERPKSATGYNRPTAHDAQTLRNQKSETLLINKPMINAVKPKLKQGPIIVPIVSIQSYYEDNKNDNKKDINYSVKDIQ